MVFRSGSAFMIQPMTQQKKQQQPIVLQILRLAFEKVKRLCTELSLQTIIKVVVVKKQL